MSVNPYIYLGFGYIFDINDEDFIANIKKNLPELAKEHISEDGSVNHMISLMYEISESIEFKEKYQGLNFTPIFENSDLVSVVVTLSTATKTLYDKYGEISSGAFYPLGRLVFADAFNGFKDDFDMFEGPKTVIWTQWL